MPDEAPKLLPCPFCGGENIKCDDAFGYAEYEDCDVYGPTAYYPSRAADAWNTRADYAPAMVAAERPIEPSDIERASLPAITLHYLEYLEAVESDRDGLRDSAQAIRARGPEGAEGALADLLKAERVEALREAAELADRWGDLQIRDAIEALIEKGPDHE